MKAEVDGKNGADIESLRESPIFLRPAVCKKYDEAETCHDGKWVMFEPTDESELDDYMKLPAVKKRPDRKG